jgi:hypothetical protein
MHSAWKLDFAHGVASFVPTSASRAARAFFRARYRAHTLRVLSLGHVGRQPRFGFWPQSAQLATVSLVEDLPNVRGLSVAAHDQVAVNGTSK